MITNYQCPNCRKLFSENDYYLHSTYCKSPTNQFITTHTYDTNPNTISTTNYLNNFNTNKTTKSIPVYKTTQKTNANNITYNRPAYISRNNTIPNKNVLIPQQRQQIVEAKTYFRPQTITYFNTPQSTQNQIYDYSQLTKNQNYSYPANTNINNLVYTCNTCGKTVPLKEQNDHILSHKLEQEEKDRLQAQQLQDEDLFENVPPEQIEQQKKIEEYIRRQQNQRNNNNLNNNNLMTNDFNFNNLNNDMGGMGNFTRMNGMNLNGMPNVIIRRVISNNNGTNNISSGMENPNFFENFFNGNMDQDFFNNPQSGNMRRIIIPMGGMGNFGGMGNQNDLNELIERMLHYNRDNPTSEAIVSELPENQIDDINKLDNDKKNCVICMEDFKNGDKSTNLPCLHMFHTNCIQSWLKKQNTCPICKFKLTEDNINNINNRQG